MIATKADVRRISDKPAQPRKDEAVAVVIYSTSGCPCSETMLKVFRDAGEQFPLIIETIDVGSGLVPAELDTSKLPVATVNGKTRFRGVANPVLVTRLLETEGRRSIDR